jgi:hypothetical protein
MKIGKLVGYSLGLVALGLFVQGCASTGTSSSPSPAASSPSPAASPAPNTASSPSTPSTSTAPKKTPTWMNAQGEVTDSKSVEAGYGQKVKGKDNWEGEITGKAAPGSKFSNLKIGMSRAEVYSTAGNPTDQGAYVTGKAWIPFYFGSDRYRYEAAYKGMGRLIFAGSAGFDSNAHLIWIIHNKNDTGFR